MVADSLLTEEWPVDRHRAVLCVVVPIVGLATGGLAIISGIGSVAGVAGVVAMATLLGIAKFASP